MALNNSINRSLPQQDNEIIVGSTGNGAILATITAGEGIAVNLDTVENELVISTTGSIPWEEITDPAHTMEVNHSYITNNVAQVVLTLPTEAAIGSRFIITGAGAGGWRVAQNAGQQIHFGNTSSTAGDTGYIESTHQRDTVELICVVADTEFNVVDAVGNIEVA